MSKIKLISAMLFVMMIFVYQQSSAQTQNTDQQTEQTDQNKDAATEPATTDGSEQPTDGYAEKVTIAESDGSANATSTGTESNSNANQPAEKIHIYSGKHDGNNVINPDPK